MLSPLSSSSSPLAHRSRVRAPTVGRPNYNITEADARPVYREVPATPPPLPLPLLSLALRLLSLSLPSKAALVSPPWHMELPQVIRLDSTRLHFTCLDLTSLDVA